VAKRRSKFQRPVDIALPVIFVKLPTLDELEAFWKAHKNQFRYACEGKNDGATPFFLREYEWVFGKSKAAVVETVMRWGKSAIRVEYHNWAESDPEAYSGFVREHEIERESAIKASNWSAADEKNYRRLPPESQRGWWRFAGLPDGYSLGSSGAHESLYDSSVSTAEVARILHERVFDEWQSEELGEVRAHNTSTVDETIDYWKSERAAGNSHYGDENVGIDYGVSPRRSIRTDEEFIALAKADPTWHEVVASFAISGMILTDENALIAGKLIVGEIDINDAKRIVAERRGKENE